MPKKEVEYLGMPIDGDLLMMFRRVKEHRGIHNSTELVRVLIKEDFDRIGSTVILSPSTLQLIDLTLQKERKFRTREELIDVAVQDCFQKKEKP